MHTALEATKRCAAPVYAWTWVGCCDGRRWTSQQRFHRLELPRWGLVFTPQGGEFYCNAFDGILVLLILVESALSGSQASGALRGARVFRFLRAFRALRIVRLYRAFYVEKVDASTQTEESDWRRPSEYAGLSLTLPSSALYS